MSPSVRERVRTLLLGALGIAAFLCLWEIVGRNRLLGLSWPALTDVLAMLADSSRWPLFSRALGATLSALGIGYVLGLGAGLAVAAAAHLSPALKPGLDRANAVIHAIPSIALAPLFILFLGRGATPAALAALTTFFVI
jgi:ABC-type nitrate/sulfonate/bicarbonate transport system permease component